MALMTTPFRESIIVFADSVGQEISTGVTTSEPVVEKSGEVQSKITETLGL